MRPRSCLLPALLLLAAPAASEPGAAHERIWLRGRGADVWIERSPRRHEAQGSLRRESIRVLEHLEARHGHSQREHAYSPRFYVPGPRCGLYPLPLSLHLPPYGHASYVYPNHFHFGHGRPHRDHGGWRHPPRRPHLHQGDGSSYGMPAYRRPGPHGGGVRSGGVLLRGGAYRRVR